MLYRHQDMFYTLLIYYILYGRYEIQKHGQGQENQLSNRKMSFSSNFSVWFTFSIHESTDISKLSKISRTEDEGKREDFSLTAQRRY